MRFLPLLALGLFSAIPVHAQSIDASLIARLAPKIKPSVINEAVSAMNCARKNGVGINASRVAIIDYTIPSRLPRLWVLDLKQQKLLFEEHVAHGQGSGHDIPNVFSDREGSHQTSLGLFLTDSTYQGGNGYSLRLHGLSKGFNESALRRLIVMHGAPYVNPIAAMAMGRLGRSWGCPAVRREVAQPMIDTLKQGQFIYSHGPGTEKLSLCKTENLALLALPPDSTSQSAR
jgi:hypothetical protein